MEETETEIAKNNSKGNPLREVLTTEK